MNEFKILEDYCYGECFYYYYYPSNEILIGTFGSTDYKVDGVEWIARKTEKEAIKDQIKYLEENNLIDKGRNLNKDKFIECIESWYKKKVVKKTIISRIEALQSVLKAIDRSPFIPDENQRIDCMGRIAELKRLLLHI